MDSWGAVRADLPCNDDKLHGDLCFGVFISILSVDAGKLTFSFGKEKVSKRNQHET